jgi:hypothetical protein
MASEEIRKYIRSTNINDGKPWNDAPGVGPFPQRRVANSGEFDAVGFAEWAHDWREWGLRVRRDILVLEHLLVGASIKQHLYGDPGDPPPDPEL